MIMMMRRRRRNKLQSKEVSFDFRIILHEESRILADVVLHVYGARRLALFF